MKQIYYLLGILILLIQKTLAFQVQVSKQESKNQNTVNDLAIATVSINDNNTLLNIENRLDTFNLSSETLDTNTGTNENTNECIISIPTFQEKIVDNAISNEQADNREHTMNSDKKTEVENLFEPILSVSVINIKEKFMESSKNEKLSEQNKHKQNYIQVLDYVIEDAQEAIQKIQVYENNPRKSQNTIVNCTRGNDDHTTIRYDCGWELIALKNMMIFIIVAISFVLVLKLFLKDLGLIDTAFLDTD